MSKEIKLIVLSLGLVLLFFLPIILISHKLDVVTRNYNQLKAEKISSYNLNRAIDSLKYKVIILNKSLDSIQVVKNKVYTKYTDKIKYVYEIKTNPATLDSLTNAILFELDSLERTGHLNPGAN